ncbi:MAG TPA: hypothetical protein VG477_01285, partial [Thermoanaerobaculia bacterium]|nr:hypothetical protein [Thermoanaerobaculia bacterium]
MRLPRVLGVLGVLAVLAPAGGFAQDCFPGDTWLCLQGSFYVQAEWRLPGGEWTEGHAVPLTGDTGTFWFFDNANTELVLKVLDGRPVNGHFWVYYGGLSDVEYRISVYDTRTQTSKTYHNPAGRLVSRSDTVAFAGGPAAKAGPVEAAVASAPSLAVPPLRQGPEFRVNDAFPGDQWSSGLAIGPDGGFLVAWYGPGIRARLFDSAGRPRTGDIALTDFGGWDARAAASPTGEYMVVWESDRLLGRVVAPDGQLGEVFPIGTTGHPQRDPVIAADPAGGFLVAWMDLGPTPPGIPTALRWQRFGPRGNRVGQERVIQRPGLDPGVAALAAGGFVLTWGERLT